MRYLRLNRNKHSPILINNSGFELFQPGQKFRVSFGCGRKAAGDLFLHGNRQLAQECKAIFPQAVCG